MNYIIINIWITIKHSFKCHIYGCGDFIGRFDEKGIFAIKENADFVGILLLELL